MQGLLLGLWPVALGLAVSAPSSGSAAPVTHADADALEAPVRLRAGDSYIDSGELIGHSGPLFADFDQRGVQDLLVGTFKGHLLLFRNTPVEGAPSLAPAGKLEANGEVLEVPNW